MSCGPACALGKVQKVLFVALQHSSISIMDGAITAEEFELQLLRSERLRLQQLIAAKDELLVCKALYSGASAMN
jgi:hypothetical protein